MTNKRSPCRIDGIIAIEANLAVIFRRGPTHCCQMLTWDMDTDLVTPGQWSKGKVFTKWSDVSPDGRYVVVFTTGLLGDYQFSDQRPGDCSTAICRPPFFFPIALWSSLGTYHGGGVWEDRRAVCLDSSNYSSYYREIAPPKEIRVKNTQPGLFKSVAMPPRFVESRWTEIRQRGPHLSYGLTRRDLSDYGKAIASEEAWREQIGQVTKGLVPEGQLQERRFDGGSIRRTIVGPWERWSLHDDCGAERRAWSPRKDQPQWVDIDAKGRVVFGEAGCLWAWADFPNGKPLMIADLNGNLFENIPTPDWAKTA